MKFVSIIIPYFKKKSFIDKTLRSIQNQIYSDYEIIIIYDDLDKDELNYLIQKTKKNKKIKILVNSKNIGAGASRNRAIKVAKGDYIAFIDADDIWKKNKLKKQMSFMTKNNYEISHTSYEIINDKNKVIGKRTAKNLNFEKLLKSCDIGLSTVVIKKKILKKFKFAKLKTKEDYVLWLQLAKNGNTFYGLNQNLSFWRLSKNSLSSSIIRKLIDGYKVYRLYFNQGVVESFLSVINLSINYLKKNA